MLLSRLSWIAILVGYCVCQEYTVTTKRPCYEEYKTAIDICEEQYRSARVQIPSWFVNITAPVDPQETCNAYKGEVSCTIIMEVSEGQKIFVKTGETYNFKNKNSCPVCRDCDFFALNQECISQTKNANERIGILNDTVVAINFTSSFGFTSGGTQQYKVSLSLKAIGCPYDRLTKDNSMNIYLFNESYINEDTENYVVSIRCPEGRVLPNQEISMQVMCRRRIRDGIAIYEWDNDKILACSLPVGVIIAIVVIVVVIPIIIIILVVLGCLGYLPCQRKRNRKGPPVRGGEMRPMATYNIKRSPSDERLNHQDGDNVYGKVTD